MRYLTRFLTIISTLVVLMASTGYVWVQGSDQDPSSLDPLAAAPVNLPPSVDLSTSDAFPPIGDQRPTESSCVGWATTYYQLTYETAQVRGWNAKSGDPNLIFSPKWTYNMINNGANYDTTFGDAYTLLIDNGAVSWADFPYDGQDFKSWLLDSALWREALQYRATGVEALNYSSDADVDTFITNVKTQLANKHLVVFSTYVGSWEYFLHYVADDPSTASDDSFKNQYIANYSHDSKKDLHALTIVGYNDDIWVDLNGNGKVDTGEKGAFKVANSRGTLWGNAGFIWMPYDALRTVSAVPASDGWPPLDRDPGGIIYLRYAYVLEVRPSYTPTMEAAITFNDIISRNEIAVTLGVGSTQNSTPSVIWKSGALSNSGGDNAFDGTNISCNGTFFFDFTDIISTSAPTARWFIGVADSACNGRVTTVSSFKLYKGTDAEPVAQNNGKYIVDGYQIWIPLDYYYVPQYTLTTFVNGNGVVIREPDQKTYDVGSQVKLTAKPAAGWVFSSWSGNQTGAINPAWVTISADMNVTASFNPAPTPTPTPKPKPKAKPSPAHR